MKKHVARQEQRRSRLEVSLAGLDRPCALMAKGQEDWCPVKVARVITALATLMAPEGRGDGKGAILWVNGRGSLPLTGRPVWRAWQTRLIKTKWALKGLRSDSTNFFVKRSAISE